MLNKIFNRQPRLEHADPAERIRALAEDDNDPADVARVLAGDASPEVRKAAAAKATTLDPLVDAATGDSDADVRAAAVARAGSLLATDGGDDAAVAWLADARLPDVIRSEAAKRTEHALRRKTAIDHIADEAALASLALEAGRAETRLAAAERVHGEAALERIHDGARNKDHGLARFARQRLDAMRNRSLQAAEADTILSALESLAGEPGPILTAVVDLNRRWQALDMSGDAERLARAEAARQAIQARFDREQDEQRAKAQFDRRLREWTTGLAAMSLPPPEEMAGLRSTLEALRAERGDKVDAPSLERLSEAERRIANWEAEHTALAGAEALVDEAEKLAADTSIDDAQLPARWQALDRSTRTPELTRRFEAALTTIETRRLATMQATMQQANAARQQLHGLLHAAEQALTAGTLQPARAALDEVRTLKASAGVLPKPTIQRLSRAIQQLSDLERWESFGQQNARMQLVERAEALAAATADVNQAAREVQKLRGEWKALDEQYKGVPKTLWERFDSAAEKAYAPAARHFADLAQQRKDAKKRRDDYVAQAAAHAPTLVTETPDWKAIDRWIRETEHGWHETSLGSVDPSTWKKLEGKLREAMAPARDALAGARGKVKAEREAMIAEVTALVPKALDRDTPSQVKAIQQRWQENARQLALTQRDERTLWEQFRAACDSVFAARQAKRSEDETRKSESKRALEAVASDLEQLARAKDTSEQDVRRAAREAQDKWRALSAKPDPAVREVEGRFRRAKTAVDDLLADRSRARESAVWQVLDAKEQLCESLDRIVRDGGDVGNGAAATARVDEQWAAAQPLPPAWEKPLGKRRDIARRAIEDASAGSQLKAAIERSAPQRREILLELELTLGLDSPKELQAERLALQVRQLKERFKVGAPTAETAGDRYVQWCAMSGVADALDRARCGKIVGALGSARGRLQGKR